MTHARSAIDGRFAALARAHDLLTRVSWENATIDSTVRSAVEPFDQGGERFIICGEDIRITSSSVIALTRRELDGEFPPFYQGLSQDTWIMKGHPVDPLLRDTANLALGIAGCENIFTAQLIANGYSVWNPCLDIRTTHNDPSPNYNYRDCKRYYGFYAFPAPCHIRDVESSIPDYQFEFQPMS
jgi:hypothetical protein